MLNNTITRIEQGLASYQEIFNEVWQWFVVQENPKSANEGDGPYSNECKYRDKHGNKCAFGIFIRDEDYHAELESNNADELAKQIPGCYANYANFFVELQGCHDQSYRGNFYEEVKSKLETCAVINDLTIPTA